MSTDPNVVAVRGISPALWREVKIAAAQRGMPIWQFVRSALCVEIQRTREMQRSVPTVSSASADTSGEDTR